jgi:hypothetical protein
MLNLSAVVLLNAPTSLASTMAIGPHHVAAAHAGGVPKRAKHVV